MAFPRILTPIKRVTFIFFFRKTSVVNGLPVVLVNPW